MAEKTDYCASEAMSQQAQLVFEEERLILRLTPEGAKLLFEALELWDRDQNYMLSVEDRSLYWAVRAMAQEHPCEEGSSQPSEVPPAGS